MSSAQSIIREVFVLFDRDGDGLIASTDVGLAVRATGVNPAETEIEKAVGKGPDMWDANKFEALCSNFHKGKDLLTDLKSAFKPFDRDSSGKLSSSEEASFVSSSLSGELKHVLRNLKNRLSDEQIDCLVGEADPQNSGIISFEKLVQILTA